MAQTLALLLQKEAEEAALAPFELPPELCAQELALSVSQRDQFLEPKWDWVERDFVTRALLLRKAAVEAVFGLFLPFLEELLVLSAFELVLAVDFSAPLSAHYSGVQGSLHAQPWDFSVSLAFFREWASLEQVDHFGFVSFL